MSEHPPELVEKVRDVLAGWPIGNGYYGTNVGTDEALGMARAVLDAITACVSVMAYIPAPINLDDSPELDALPDGSVIFDADEDVMFKDEGEWWFWGADSAATTATVHLPALLIHRPPSGTEAPD